MVIEQIQPKLETQITKNNENTEKIVEDLEINKNYE